MALKPDCLHFKGDRPCAFRRLCEGCPDFEPFPTRILIIKGGAGGDVLRTTPLLPALKRKYRRSHITWLVAPESTQLLLGNPSIDRLLPYQLETVSRLLLEKFDVLISLDKEPGLTSVASKIDASLKLGFGMNEYGNLVIFNKATEYAYRLGVDDNLKFFKNKKTYQEIIHEIAEVPFARDEYTFALPEGAQDRARRFFKRHRISPGKPLIGLNTGAGTKFPAKQWPVGHFLDLIVLLQREIGGRVFLLGGPREQEMNLHLERQSPLKVYNTGSDNSLLQFAGFISLMDLIVSADTLGLHLAVALRKKVAALFGPTCPQEVDLYGRGVKIFGSVDCSPCYRRTCADMKCMKEITADRVLAEIQKII